MLALTIAAVSFLGTLILTPAVAWLARRLGIIDRPGAVARKHHYKPTPLLGGLAVFIVFAAVILLLKYFKLFPESLVPWTSVIGLLVGGAVLMVGGVLDDKYDLPPRLQILFPLIAVFLVVFSGVTITYIRSPFGGVIPLDDTVLSLGSVFGLPLSVLWPADVLAFLWILGMTYTTKVLDGLDGLVSGLAVIAAILIFFVALRPELNQPDVAILSAAAAGAFAGFLVWNFPPARVFLGEGGSTFAGFLIGTLAVISGSKVATTLLVLGAPILDLGLVIIGRLRQGRPLVSGDMTHLHFRLLTAGLSPRTAVLILYAMAIGFGSIGLIASTKEKAVAFLILAAVVVLISRYLRKRV